MADATELWQCTLVEIGERIASGEVSPVEVTRACLARTERLGPALNATTTILGDQALAAARQAEREIVGGTHRGPLHGVPIGIKDLADVAGVPTTVGSHVFHGHVAERDSTLVRQLKRAGAVILAKMNCDEMALHPTGAISQFGPGLNPWNTSRASGGSSSGSGIAVAAGMMFGALGSDTGGSIRIPASACGVVGIKPTYGRVSLDGVRLLAPTFDTPGPMARTTLDAALMLRAMVDPDDEASIREANRLTHLVPDADAGLDGLRIGVPSSYFFEEIDPEIERLVRGAIDALARLGAELVAVELSSLPMVIESHWGIMILESLASISAATGGDLTRVGEAVRERLAAGLEVLQLDPRDSAGRHSDACGPCATTRWRTIGAPPARWTPSSRLPSRAHPCPSPRRSPTSPGWVAIRGASTARTSRSFAFPAAGAPTACPWECKSSPPNTASGRPCASHWPTSAAARRPRANGRPSPTCR